jgi:hypothetical protein
MTANRESKSAKTRIKTITAMTVFARFSSRSIFLMMAWRCRSDSFLHSLGLDVMGDSSL